jgi:molecular chaperone HscB
MADPFDTLGIEPRFDLDIAQVERRFRELSRVVHPDRFTSAGGGERRRALGRAVDVNEAFRVVRDPIRRAEALLARLGVAFSETAQPKASPALLMEFMELREELAEARSGRKLDRITALSEQVRGRERGVLDRLSAGFTGALQPGGAPPDGQALASMVGELRYVRRFLEEVRAIDEELGEQAAG